MNYVGIDVGKEHCALNIMDAAGENETTLTIPNNPDGYRELETRLDEGDKLALEASTYAFPIYRHFDEKGYNVYVAHPRKLHLIAENETKTDDNDARILANLLRVGYLPEAYLPPPEVLRIREIARDRREVGEELGRWKTRIQSHVDKHGLEPPVNDLWTQTGRAWLKEPTFGDERDQLVQARVLQVEVLEDRKNLLEQALAQIAVDDERVHWLMSIPGARWYLATYTLGEVGEITRFDDVDAFKNYCGCCPKERSTGGRQDPYGVIQHGHKGLKWAFGMIARTLIGYRDNPVKAEYEKGMQDTGDHGKAKARARREVCELVYWLLTKEELCNWSSESMVDRKLRDARRWVQAS